MLEKLKAAWIEWRRKREWNAELQLYHLRIQVIQDHRWMAHDPKVSALCARYLDMLADDWEKRAVSDVRDFRREIGCDPWGNPHNANPNDALVPTHIWAVGTVVDEKHWMAESLHWDEVAAAKAAKPGQFIVLCPIGMDFPAEATEAEKLYYPNEEQWEQSALFQMREKLTA